MPRGSQTFTVLQTDEYGGLNTALQFSQIDSKQSPNMLNGYMSKIGSIAKRFGSIPIASPLGTAIRHVTVYHAPTADEVLVASGTSIYKLGGTLLASVTMTNALVSSDIYTTAFTDASSASTLIITDGGVLKRYNGTNVANITAAPNDDVPEPPNILGTSLASKALKYCWTYSSHIFVSDGSDGFWYSKRFTNDYFPSVQYQRYVRENDYITGCGVAFNNVMLVPMRRGWGILSGSTFDDFVGSKFLNTVNGNVAPRSIQRVTYPSGTQAIIYLSDDGVYEVYDTGYQDTGSRQYATRNTMANKIDFEEFNFTEAQKQAASSYFDARLNLYMMSIMNTDGTDYTFAYDVRNGEWYVWTGVKCHYMARSGERVIMGGRDGVLRQIRPDLYSDWDDMGKSVGTPVMFERYSPLLSVEFNGFASVWDEYIIEMKQWSIPSTLDVDVAFSGMTVGEEITNTGFVWSESGWGQSSIGNYSDLVGVPRPMIFCKMSRYAQVRWRNFRDEPVEVYRDKWKIRISGG